MKKQFWIALVVVIFISSGITLYSLKQRDLDFTEEIIPDFSIGFKAGISKNLPEINENSLWKALQFISKMHKNPFLNTREDEKIFDLANKYLSKAKKFNLKPFDTCNQPAAMVYSVEEDCYYYHRKERTSMPLLALRLYHEMKHAADTAETKKQGKLEEYYKLPRWKREYSPTIAELRFIQVLQEGNLIPEVSIEDIRLLSFSANALRALQKNNFPEFYENFFKTGKFSEDCVEIRPFNQ